MLHIPILRKGVPYKSLDVATVSHHRSRQPFVEISQANVGLIRRDLLDQPRMKALLNGYKTQELFDLCVRAAAIFAADDLPLGDSVQSPTDYVVQLSATTGMPYALVRRNMEKVRSVLANIEMVVNGLTRHISLDVLDVGYGEIEGQTVSFFPRGNSLGVVLPSNSPGVHSLWIPAIAMKIPLVLKPGSAEPWTPYRVIQALIKAGCPPDVFCFYPTDHAGGGEILRQTGRGMMFGDSSSTGKWKNDPRIEIHGPGYSKVVIGEDKIDNWEQYIDVIARSIAENGGRSCINASGVWVPRHGRQIAEALGARLAELGPRAIDDPEASLAPFADANVAARISKMIDQGFNEEGAQEVTASYRQGGRLVTHDESTYVLPTIVHCQRPEHNLANREFLFPYASVVEVAQAEMPEVLGPSLVVTAITEDEPFIQRLISSPLLDRLNIGAIPTMQISWDQPHEGNLFDHLYSRRAFQRAAAATQ
ncbi:MAG: aldehyde dehydrogenase family protein [Acidobacteriota bacterium]